MRPKSEYYNVCTFLVELLLKFLQITRGRIVALFQRNLPLYMQSVRVLHLYWNPLNIYLCSGWYAS